jgi:hypothetical protein
VNGLGVGDSQRAQRAAVKGAFKRHDADLRAALDMRASRRKRMSE